LTIVLAAGVPAYRTAPAWKETPVLRETKMSETKNLDLFVLIDLTSRSFPLTKEGIEKLMNVSLRLAQENDYVKFYEGGPVSLAGGLQADNIDLRLHKSRPADKGFLVLNLSGACLTLDAIKARYHDLEITGIPRGGSVNETTSYSTLQPWGKLSFGFAEARPDCLATVVMDPQARSLRN
jgi:hypothetical protein